MINKSNTFISKLVSDFYGHNLFDFVIFHCNKKNLWKHRKSLMKILNISHILMRRFIMIRISSIRMTSIIFRFNCHKFYLWNMLYLNNKILIILFLLAGFLSIKYFHERRSYLMSSIRDANFISVIFSSWCFFSDKYSYNHFVRENQSIIFIIGLQNTRWQK
jgi:hypothetical protein